MRTQGHTSPQRKQPPAHINDSKPNIQHRLIDLLARPGRQGTRAGRDDDDSHRNEEMILNNEDPFTASIQSMNTARFPPILSSQSAIGPKLSMYCRA